MATHLLLVVLAFGAREARAPQAPAPVDSVVCVGTDAPAPDSLGRRPVCRVDAAVEPPTIVSQQRALLYPDHLRDAGVQGEVVVQVIIDTVGRAEPASVRIVRAVHRDFEAPVREWVPGVVFAPGRLHGRAVRVLVTLPLEFALQAVDDSSAAPADDLIAAARAQITARNVDSAAALLERVATDPERDRAERVQAWVLLGVVRFYAEGDSATAAAFRSALALDPGLQVPDLQRYDPAIAGLLEAERNALVAAAPPATVAAAGPNAAPAVDVYECINQCPDGVRPPWFTFFPRMELVSSDASVRGRSTRMRSYLVFHGVIGANGALELETLVLSGGTARDMETDLRRGLAQARFEPARAGGVPVRARVALRFEFEAEGTSWVKYTYRVVAR